MLESGPLRLRPLAAGDARAWQAARRRNLAWLQRWDATAPSSRDARPRTFGAMTRAMRKAARAGTQLPFAIEFEGRFVGQITVNNIVRGSAQFASVGYWIDEAVAGRGLMTRAVAMVIDHCFGPVGLHRIEVNIRPENAPSRRVAQKLGLREEGLRVRYLHIDGNWRDHCSYAVSQEEVPEGMLARWRAAQASPIG